MGADHFTYDLLGRPETSSSYLPSNGQSFTTRYRHSSDGRTKTVIDPQNCLTTYKYDQQSRLIAKVNAEGQEFRYVYDKKGNLVRYIDASGVTYAYEYNEKNRKVKEILPNGKQIVFRYDGRGRLIESVDALGQRTNNIYDKNGYLQKRCVYDDSETLVKEIEFLFDKNGLLKKWSDGIFSAVFEYDESGRRTKQTIDYGGFVKRHSYQYYPSGLKKSFTASDGAKYFYNYDKNKNLVDILFQSGEKITFFDYLVNRPKRVVFPKNQVLEYEYDDFLRITNIKLNVKNHLPIHSLAYAYSPNGQITTIVHNRKHKNFSYDKIGQLRSAPEGTYGYDEMGNRLNVSWGKTDWIYDENHQLITDDSYRYLYDFNGSLISVKGENNKWEFDYNEEGRLETVYQNGSLIAQYDYDPFGRRIRKTIDDEITYYYYTDEGLVAEYDAQGNELKSYGYIPNSIWSTNSLWLKKDSKYYWYLNDHLGTPQRLIDSDGKIVWQAEYESFGQATIKLNQIENNLRFPGQYFDKETGMHNNLFRYYLPHLGRFNHLDPLFVGNPWFGTRKHIRSLKGHRDPIGNCNFYVYTGNDPINKIDPLGLFRFGKRPLKNLPWIPIASDNPLDDAMNTEICHEQGFFEDGSGENVGFGDKGRSYNEDTEGKGYRYDDEYYDDDLMREALDNVEDGEYSALGPGKNNCQDWADRLRDEYEIQAEMEDEDEEEDEEEY